MKQRSRNRKRGTVLLMIVGLLAMLFMIITAYITLARFDRLTMQMSSNGGQVDEIIDSLNDVVTSAIARSWTDDRGNIRLGGESFADIPGYGGTPWLASDSPVRITPSGGGDFSNAWQQDYVYPGVTSLSGNAGNLRLTELMWELPVDGDDEFDVDDIEYNVRNGFMDADGDGLPDSVFTIRRSTDPNVPVGIGSLTELANAMAGRVVQSTRLRPNSLPSDLGDVDSKRWSQFMNNAQYFVAARVVSHGGMVPIGIPLYQNNRAWNLEFTVGLFNGVKYSLASDLGLGDRYLLERTYEQSSAIEPLLRLRGGMLLGAQASNPSALPSALADWQKNFPDTLLPSYLNSAVDYNKRSRDVDPWQRFNHERDDEFLVWRKAAYMDADRFNDTSGTSDVDAAWNRRQALTAANYSDDLARDQRADMPKINGFGTWTVPGIFPGQPKFYLGRVADCFDGNGRFIRPEDPDVASAKVIRELVNYYYEMLGDYEFNEEATTRRQQAHMLAVNTVAFAAPYRELGGGAYVVDAVHYTDPISGELYLGQAPQPYISQVIAYRNPPSGSDPNNPADPNNPPDPNSPGNDTIELAVELYNPHDSLHGGYPLLLEQFAISLNDDHELNGSPGDSVALAQFIGEGLNFPTEFEGRRFLTFLVGTGTYFENAIPSGAGLPKIQRSVGTTGTGEDETITVKLWRALDTESPATGTWVKIDEFELEAPPKREDSTDPGGGPPPPDPNDPWEGSYTDAWRDMHTEPYWGRYDDGMGGAGLLAARWRCVVPFPAEDDDYHGITVEDMKPGEDGKHRPLETLGSPRPEAGADEDPVQPRDPWAPTVPLYTMNAGADPSIRIHGCNRPASFPTVGFMLFVPRYAHRMPPVAKFTVAAEHRSVGEWLYEEWDEKDYPAAPLDFGHMPIFDNEQEVREGSSFKQLGEVPWGQLVFDYFTTIDPYDANGDGNRYGVGDATDRLDVRRIPGRININTAAWNILKELPVIGPESGTPDGDFNALRNPKFGTTPAFWNSEVGIFAGEAYFDSKPRFIGNTDARLVTSGGWWRLGPQLAQAAVGYRDRVWLTDDIDVPVLMQRAFLRNSYRPTLYDGVRGAGDPNTAGDWDRGFLALGELANVVGFDSSDDQQLASGASYTVLGGGGYGDTRYGDFFKSVSLLALLDTHFLTTRSNVFTVYVTLTVNDPEDTQASVRSQVTVDRTNLLPQLVMIDVDEDGIPDTPALQRVDTDDDGIIDASDDFGPVVLPGTGLPEPIGERQTSYFNARHEN